MTNFFIRINGFLKRVSRVFRVFAKQNKSTFKYIFLGLFAVCLIGLSAVFIIGGNFDFNFDWDWDFNFNLKSEKTPEPSTTVTVTETPAYEPTPTPEVSADIYLPLIVLDCSSFNDNGYLQQFTESFGQINGIECTYVKVHESEFVKTYNKMVEDGTAPNIVIAPNHLLMDIGGFMDTSDISGGLNFNNAALGAVESDRLPLALEMYGYFFRTDLLDAMSRTSPALPQSIREMSEKMRSDSAYYYLKRTETDELKAAKYTMFQASRYGFGFAGSDAGGELFLKTAMDLAQLSAINFMYDVEYMWDESCLPPNTAYATDDTLKEAYLNDALCGVFTSGVLYESINNYSYNYYGSELKQVTELKLYLGDNPIYTANPIYCAITDGSDAFTAKSYMKSLYEDGNLFRIIAQNHTAFLPAGLVINQYTPWLAVYDEGANIIYFDKYMYTDALKDIILAGKSVEQALADAMN